MKRYLGITAGLCLLSTLALAETWSGTLVDVNCKAKDLATHTKKCAVGCAKSGYGLMLSDGKFVKLDEEGNTKALAALKAYEKDTDLKATVSGTLDGDVIKVSSIDMAK